jgi:DnaK suppressor protein
MAAKKVVKKQGPKKSAKPVVKKAPAKPAPKKIAKPVVKKAPAKPAAKKIAKPVVKKAPAKPAAKKIAKPVVAKVPAKPTPVVNKSTTATTPSKPVAPSSEKPADTAKSRPVFKPLKKAVSMPEPPSIIVEPITDPKFLAFAEKQKHRLLDLRDDIVDAMTGSAREAIRSSPEGSEASGSGMHQGDAGSDAYDREFALSVLAKDQSSLYEIDDALLRIKKGLYGLCEMSGKRIPIARLEAIPFARLTVDCQAQWEKEHGKRQFRPSGSVGFSGGGIFEEDEETETILLDDDED